MSIIWNMREVWHSMAMVQNIICDMCEGDGNYVIWAVLYASGSNCLIYILKENI